MGPFQYFKPEIKTFFIVVLIATALTVGGILLLKSIRPVPVTQVPQPTPTPSAQPQSTNNQQAAIDTPDWQTYRSEEFGFSFAYPENRFPYFSEEAEPNEQLGLSIAPAAKLESLRLTDTWISILVLLYSPNFTLDEYLTLHEDPEYYKDARRKPIEIGGSRVIN